MIEGLNRAALLASLVLGSEPLDLGVGVRMSHSPLDVLLILRPRPKKRLVEGAGTTLGGVGGLCLYLPMVQHET